MTRSFSLCALAILGSTHAAPQMLKVFTSGMKQTSSFEGAGVTIDVVSEGKLYYDGRTRRIRQDFASISQKTEMPGGDLDLGGGLDGGLGVGLGGDTDGAGAGAGSMEMKMRGNGVNLLRYDLGKNFTWFAEDGKTDCECTDLEGEFPPLFVDPTATFGASETITVNNLPVTAEKWTSTLGLGGVAADSGVALDSTLTYHVQDNKLLRRMKLETSFSAGGMDMKNSVVYDMWDIKDSVVDAMWTPHASCVCAKPPAPSIQTTYPEPAAAAAATCQAEAGCQCLDNFAQISSDPQTAGLVFCKDIVSWPVLKTLFPKETDDFVETAYTTSVELIMTGESEKCKSDYKEFMCQFYFQICKKDAKVSIPGKFVSDKCTSDPEPAGAASETYTTVATLEEKASEEKESSAYSSSTVSLTGGMLLCMLMLLLGC